jgi:hypothetical protein
MRPSLCLPHTLYPITHTICHITYTVLDTLPQYSWCVDRRGIDCFKRAIPTASLGAPRALLITSASKDASERGRLRGSLSHSLFQSLALALALSLCRQQSPCACWAAKLRGQYSEALDRRGQFALTVTITAVTGTRTK